MAIIHVHDIDGLYKAVNGDANDGKGNEGAIVLLSPNNYKLLDNGINRNAGRLELQPGMELHGTGPVTMATGIKKLPSNDGKHGDKSGTNFHPALTVATIDGSGLDYWSFTINKDKTGAEPARTGFIVMGNRYNVLADLQIIGNTKINDKGQAIALSAIDTYHSNNGPAELVIENTIIIGGTSGICIRNAGTSNCANSLKATLTRNEIYNMSMQNLPAQGILIQNSVGANNSRIRVSMQENYLHDNTTGLRIMNQDVSDGDITVLSVGDWFVRNTGNGILIIGGEIRTDNTYANNNAVIFIGTRNSLQQNEGIASLDFGQGQAYVVGASTVVPPLTPLPDAVNANGVVFYLGSPLIEDLSSSFLYHINAYGAVALSPVPFNILGINNSATVLWDNASSNMKVNSANILPAWLPVLGNNVVVK